MSEWDMYKKLILMAAMSGLFIGALGGYVTAKMKPSGEPKQEKVVVSEDVFVNGILTHDGATQLTLSDGRHGFAVESKHDKSGSLYNVSGTWYKVKP